jgi:hypothetical protein
MDVVSAGMMLAEPLSRLAKSLTGLSVNDRAKVAKTMDDISACAAMMAQALSRDISGNVNRLIGNMKMYAANLHHALQDAAPQVDVDEMVSRITSVLEVLIGSYDKDPSRGALERSSSLHELERLSGEFETLGNIIRELPTKSHVGSQLSTAKLVGAASAVATAIGWFANSSLDTLVDNSVKIAGWLTRSKEAGDDQPGIDIG